MDALKALADTNMKISEAKNALATIKKDEAEYITAREAKALDAIQRVLDDSAALIKQAKENYTELGDLYKSASELATFVIEAQGNFKKMIADFEERNVLWQEKVTKQEAEMVSLWKQIKTDKTEIANEKKNIARAQKKLDDDKKKIADEWGEIERAIKRLKENRI